MNKIQVFLEKTILPFSTKLSNNKFMKSLSGGMMGILPMMMVGAVFSILTNLPIDPYKAFLASTGLERLLKVGTLMTTDIVSIYIVFSVGKSFASSKGYEKESGMIGLLCLLSFFILMPFGTTEAGTNFFEFTYLGSQGMFVGLICGALVPSIYDWIVKKDISIKLPEGVPYNVASSFTNIIPALCIAVVFIFVNFLFSLTSYGNIFTSRYALLQAPLQGLAGNMISMVIMVVLCQILWFFGIHGSMTVLGVIFPLWMIMYAENVAAYTATGTVPNVINLAFFDYTTIGGCGCTLGLAILLVFFSKSKQNKTMGKLFLPCGIFNINEPMVFSMPLMLNPMFIIPFILAPLLAVGMAYVAIVVLGIVPAPIGMMGVSYVPIIFRGIINGSVQGAILEVAIVLMSIVVYYPFFKMADKQALELERASTANNSETMELVNE